MALSSSRISCGWVTYSKIFETVKGKLYARRHRPPEDLTPRPHHFYYVLLNYGGFKVFFALFEKQEMNHVSSLHWKLQIWLFVNGYLWSIRVDSFSFFVVQNVSRLLMNIQLPRAEDVSATVLRSVYSQLRRVGSVGFQLFHSTELETCYVVQTDAGGSSAGGVTGQCFRLGYLRSNVV